MFSLVAIAGWIRSSGATRSSAGFFRRLGVLILVDGSSAGDVRTMGDASSATSGRPEALEAFDARW